MIEKLVAEHGEQHRAVITHALNFLDENEEKWGLNTPMNREGFIREVISKVPKREEQGRDS
jgi:hypothetical protein